ncbi:60S ribosomal protein L12 [Sciurus carolinensis]|uniref:60S ribosomal protein L12 n=1 Tax=Sciurus carolinensis TaxID=30640 RepID=A0AA41N390_SCICA|nr:60S ribosomal protein L12 [Sciurus carolinensis]
MRESCRNDKEAEGVMMDYLIGVPPDEIIEVVYLKCTGGKVGATSALAPKIGPLSVSKKRELSGMIEEILGAAQSVGCNIDGHHPHDIIDDINSNAVECPAS